MEILLWSIVFVVSLGLLIKSADWLLNSSEKIGLAIGLSPFIVGVTIVAFGTSFPELISSLFAVFEGVDEIVVANAVGSNIANILLVIGFSVIFAKRLVVTKSLIDLDLPLLALATTIFMFMAWDGEITFMESLFLVITYGVYLVSALFYKEERKTDMEVVEKPKVSKMDLVMLFVGVIGLALGAKYLIDSIVGLSSVLNIGAGVIAITAVAIGTSLPELLVSVKAAIKGKSEVALGNIFGSNVFNPLVVVGVPGLISNLSIGPKIIEVGFPTLIVATVLFIVSGISKRIHLQEGILYLVIYVLFIVKLFEIF
jgi:cation:H+ antiporter